MAQNTIDLETARLRVENSTLKELLAVHEQSVFEQSDRIEGVLSELRRRSAELESAEVRIRTIMNSAADGIITLDANCVIESFNSAAEEMFGCTAEQVIGKGASEVMPGLFHCHDGVRSYSDSELSICCAGTQEVAGTRGDGTEFPIEVRVSNCQIGEQHLFIAVLRDIGERKHAEQELSKLNAQLMTASRHAGMTEIATGVLHNVGNVLNSVNVSAGILSEQLSKSKVSGLVKATQLIAAHNDDLGTFFTENEKGKKLTGYLAKLAQHLMNEQETMTYELESLTDNIEHIKRIVIAQQSHAGTFGVVESVSIEEVVRDAIMVNTSSFERHEIEFEIHCDNIPRISLDKQRLLQILVNLIKNAKQAMVARKGSHHRLTVRARLIDESRIRIEFQDTGVGIPPENLNRIFTYGFTTKPEGHGFGLHSSAIAAKEMGGSLCVDSKGVNLGTTFALELPISTASSEAKKT
jgi:PAS domain S-box-containing protein